MEDCPDQELSVAVPVTDEALLRTLPTALPEFQRLEFTRRGEGWPPRPLGQEQVRRIHAQEMPGALTEDLERQVREAALSDPRVREMLGARYVHMHSDAVSPGKGMAADCSQPAGVRLTFHSYDRNASVEVLTRGAHVEAVASREGDQPAEVEEEILAAICLARADCRLKGRVELLAASAILHPMSAEEPGQGHRTLWVTFMDPADIEDEKPALFSAAVDLVDRVVLVARPEPPIARADGGADHA